MKLKLALLLCLFLVAPIGSFAEQNFESVAQIDLFKPSVTGEEIDVSTDAIYVANRMFLEKYDFDGVRISRNKTGASFLEMSVSPNGNYISGISNQYELIGDTYEITQQNLLLMDEHGDILWTKDMGIRADYGFVDISNNGNVIFSISKKGETQNYVRTVLPTEVHVYNKEGNDIFTQEFSGFTYVSISDINFAIVDLSKKKFCLYDLNAQMSFTKENIENGLVTSNGKTVIISRGVIEKYDNNGNLLKITNESYSNSGLRASYDGDLIVLFPDYINDFEDGGDDWSYMDPTLGKTLIIDDNLNVNIEDIPLTLWSDRDISLSPSGEYILARPSLDSEYLFVYTNIIQGISPRDNEIIDTNIPTFRWESTNALEYIIKIDGEEYKTNNLEFTPQSKLSPGKHTWSVQRIGIDGIDTPWSNDASFIISTNETVVTEKSFVENPLTLYGGGVSLVILAIIGMFFVRPYYKRAKVRRNMMQKSTDWCPNCHKFTGGTKICPHCGGNTMVEIDIKKMSEKIKSKKK